MTHFIESLESRSLPTAIHMLDVPAPLAAAVTQPLQVESARVARATRLRAVTPNVTGLVGESVEVRFALRSGGVGVANRRIQLYNNEGVLIGSALTGANGEVTFRAPVATPGLQTVKAIFAGGSHYRRSSGLASITGLNAAVLRFDRVSIISRANVLTVRFTWRVTDRVGNPLPNAKVLITGSTDPALLVLGATTGPDGRANMVAQLLPNAYGKTVLLSADLDALSGYRSVSGPVTVPVRLV